jgi:hypothetical protein
MPVGPVSGFVRSQAEAAAPRATSFQRALPAVQAARSMPELGTELGHAVRSAAASLLLIALLENESQLADPLGFFEGALDLATSHELIQEASVAVIYLLHQALTRSGFAEAHAIELVQATAQHALRGGTLPVPEMSRYFASDMPAEEFHRGFCRLLGVAGTEAAERALTDFVRDLSRDAGACAAKLRGALNPVG